MNMHRNAALGMILAFAALLVPNIGTAARMPASAQIVTAQTLEDFEYQAARIRAEMLPGKRYADLKRRDLNYVNELLDRIHVVLEAHGPVARMAQEQQIELLNLQERVNAVLTGNESERLLCEWTRVAGSQRRQQICMTSAERERIRARDREMFLQRVQQGRVGG